MIGFEHRESSNGDHGSVSPAQPGLPELESVLSGQASRQVEMDVERCLLDSHSPLAQLVDLLGSHEIVPPSLFGGELFGDQKNATREQSRRHRSKTPVGSRCERWAERFKGRWTAAGLFSAAVVAAVAFSVFWRPPSAALAGVERQLRVSQSRLDEALMLLDQEDYSEAEMASIQLRASLDGIRASTSEHLAQRRRIAIRAWTLESISLGQRGSFEAAEASLAQARNLLRDDRSDRLSAAALAYASGKVEFQKSQRQDVDLATRGRHLIRSEHHLIQAFGLVMGQNPSTPSHAANDAIPAQQRSHERLREQLDSFGAGTPVDARLAVRIAITLATTIHKSATPSTRQRDLELALWLYEQSGELLERNAPTAADPTWDLLHVQLAERRGLTLTSLAKFPEALAGYESAIHRLEHYSGADAVKFDYPLGVLNSNRADVLCALGERSREIEARSAALRHLERFFQARPTTSGFVNLRLNRARRALALFAQGEAVAAIDDVIAFFAITPAFANDVQLAQLTPFESARLYLIAAWHKARTNGSADAELQWAASQLASDTKLDGLNAEQRRAAIAPYLRLAELERCAAYRALRDRVFASETVP